MIRDGPVTLATVPGPWQEDGVLHGPVAVAWAVEEFCLESRARSL